MKMVHFDLTMSLDDLAFLQYTIQESLKVDTVFMERYPDETGSCSERIDSAERLLHILSTSGEFV